VVCPICMVGAGQGASSMRRFLSRSFRSLPFGQAMIIPHTSAGRKPRLLTRVGQTIMKINHLQYGKPVVRGKIVEEDTKKRVVSFSSFSRETLVTDIMGGRTVTQMPRKKSLFSTVFQLILFLLLSLPAYFALTLKEDGVLLIPNGEICFIFPAFYAILWIFANRKSITVTIENGTLSQVVKKGNRIISEEKVDLRKVTGTMDTSATQSVKLEEIEHSLGKSRHEMDFDEFTFESNKLGDGTTKFIQKNIFGEKDGEEVFLMELKFYDSTGGGISNAKYASTKVEEGIIHHWIESKKDVSLTYAACKKCDKKYQNTFLTPINIFQKTVKCRYCKDRLVTKGESTGSDWMEERPIHRELVKIGIWRGVNKDLLDLAIRQFLDHQPPHFFDTNLRPDHPSENQ